MSRVMFALVVLCGSVAYGQPGQPGYIPGMPYQPYTPGSTAVVNQVVNPPVQPQMVPIQPNTVPAVGVGGNVPPDWMQNGYREEFKQTHDLYPFREWNYPGQPHIYQNQQVVYPPQQQWQYPTYYQQPAYYYQPQCQQYRCQPACQYYCQPQCQQYYYQPQNCLQRWLGW